VAVIVTENTPAAGAATSTIPIVFVSGADPVAAGLVTSLNRPGGNMTGVSFLQTMTVASRLQMLHDAAPKAAIMGMMVNPTNPNSEPNTREAQEAASKSGNRRFADAAFGRDPAFVSGPGASEGSCCKIARSNSRRVGPGSSPSS
jgi:putative ABC transport system substrate-binding protein